MPDKRMKADYDKMSDELKAIVDKAEQEYDKSYNYIFGAQKILQFLREESELTGYHFSNYCEEDVNKSAYVMIMFMCSPNKEWQDMTGVYF